MLANQGEKVDEIEVCAQGFSRLAATKKTHSQAAPYTRKQTLSKWETPKTLASNKKRIDAIGEKMTPSSSPSRVLFSTRPPVSRAMLQKTRRRSGVLPFLRQKSASISARYMSPTKYPFNSTVSSKIRIRKVTVLRTTEHSKSPIACFPKPLKTDSLRPSLAPSRSNTHFFLRHFLRARNNVQ